MSAFSGKPPLSSPAGARLTRRRRGPLLTAGCAVVCASAAAIVYACGPFFPLQLLDDRNGTLLGTPSNSFIYEASHLVNVPANALIPPAETLNAEAAATASSAASAPPGAIPVMLGPQAAAAKQLGDKALLLLRDTDGMQCDYRSFMNQTPCAAGIPAQKLKQAIALYADQAARGSDSGVQSLRLIAAWALGDAARATPLIDDPLTQRLLIAYALARVGDIVGDDPSSASEYYGGYDLRYGTGGYADAARGDATIKPNPVLQSLVDAIQARGLTQIASADRLAALAYRVGRYDLAATLVKGQHSALAEWVTAKLALRAGQLDAAAQAYAEASKAFPALSAQGDTSVSRQNVLLLRGEQGVLQLARGQYMEALRLLYLVALQRDQQAPDADAMNGIDVGYQEDVAYIAERVLRVDELKQFVDEHAPATPVPPLPPVPAAGSPDTNLTDTPPRSVSDWLRYLLARRLMRDGRVSEALAYFPTKEDRRFAPPATGADGEPVAGALDYRRVAADYGTALHDAQNGWWRVTRARGWYTAASILQQYGMELTGFEQDPDYADSDGSYNGGSGRLGGTTSDPAEAAVPIPAATAARTAMALPGKWIGADEKQRFAASESRPYQRFQYRAVATIDAQRSADLLPPRSQAFSAVLCQASSWRRNDDPPQAKALYQRYVKEGVLLPGSAAFGLNCPTPDFHAAAWFPLTHRWHQLVRFVQQHRVVTGASAAGLLILVILLSVLRRRQRDAHGRYHN